MLQGALSQLSAWFEPAEPITVALGASGSAGRQQTGYAAQAAISCSSDSVGSFVSVQAGRRYYPGWTTLQSNRAYRASVTLR